MKTRISTRVAAVLAAALLVFAAAGLASIAQARNGADDPVGHVRHGGGNDEPANHDAGDDHGGKKGHHGKGHNHDAGDDHGGHGGDDGSGHDLGDDHGGDD